jgi:hypothetical protein
MWRLVAGCGGMWRDVAGCGEMWRDVAGCGGMWRDVVGCGEMWRDVGRQHLVKLDEYSLIVTLLVTLTFVSTVLD